MQSERNQPTLDYLLKIRDDHLDMALVLSPLSLGLIQTMPRYVMLKCNHVCHASRVILVIPLPYSLSILEQQDTNIRSQPYRAFLKHDLPKYLPSVQDAVSNCPFILTTVFVCRVMNSTSPVPDGTQLEPNRLYTARRGRPFRSLYIYVCSASKFQIENEGLYCAFYWRSLLR